LPEEWKKSIIVPIDTMGDKLDCSDYRGTSLFVNYVQILSNILLSNLPP